MQISEQLPVHEEAGLIFWGLLGATLGSRYERRQRAATRVLLSEWEVVPRTTRKRDMGEQGRASLLALSRIAKP